MARLSRESIAQAAIAIADEDGVDAVSMRRVALRLEVGTMSLYHYVRDKQALYTAMGDAIMAEQLIPEDEVPEGWREGLAEIARRAHQLFRAHPWVLASWHAGDRAAPGESFIKHIEQTLAIVSDLDFLPLEERMVYAGLVDAYAVGFVMHNALDEDEGFITHIAAMAATGEYPRAAAAFAEFDDPPKDEFERGLTVILDGIEVAIERSRRASARPLG